MNFRRAAASLFCALGPICQTGFSQENYAADWGAHKNIILNTAASGANVASAQLKFPILVRLGSGQADVFSGALSNGADLRFSKPDGTSLPYQIENWDATNQEAEVWVLLDTVQGNNAVQNILMYWNNPHAADSSKGAKVFDTADGFQGVWHLNNSLNDATVNANNAVSSGTANAVGFIGSGRSFNGTSQYLDLGTSPSLNISGKITMTAWVRWLNGGPSGTQSHRHILTHVSAPTANTETSFRLYQLQYHVTAYDGTDHYAACTYTAADSAQWVYLAGAYDGSKWHLYRNAVDSARSDTLGALPSAGRWLMGAWADAGTTINRYFSGTLDEVRIENVARSADWIKLCYENQKTGQTLVTFGATQTTGVIPALSSPRTSVPDLQLRWFDSDPAVWGSTRGARDLRGRLLRPAASPN